MSPGTYGRKSSLLASSDRNVPDHANKPMVIYLALQAGLTSDSLYFNIESVGNASAASIPLAIHDAVRDGVIKEPMRIFAPGFGAGAVAGYCVMRIDPAIVAIETEVKAEDGAPFSDRRQPRRAPSPDDAQLAFG